MNPKIVLFAILLFQCLCLPSSFDFRVQPSLIKYADYGFRQEGTCVAHNWGQQLAQILSNAFSLQMKSKIRLSSQHLIECISSKNQICHDTTLQNIHSGINYISKYGITTTQCIKQHFLSKPRDFCPRQCDDEYKFPYQIKGKFTKHQNFEQMLKELSSNEVTTAFVIYKVYNSLNYYSSEKPINLNEIPTNQPFEYRVGEVVGWKNKGQNIVLRGGLGEGWGYNGFGSFNAETHKQLIVEMYTLKVLASDGMKIKIEKQQTQ